jgi:GNAT superfamily N-acetyltransferase
MEIRVRPFHPHDYPRLAKIKCEAEGEQLTVEDIRHYDERWDHSRFEKVRVVAQDEEGVAIGYGELHHEPDQFDPRRYFLHLAVDTPYRRRGVATASVTAKARVGDTAAKRGVVALSEASRPTVKLPVALAGTTIVAGKV